MTHHVSCVDTRSQEVLLIVGFNVMCAQLACVYGVFSRMRSVPLEMNL